MRFPAAKKLILGFSQCMLLLASMPPLAAADDGPPAAVAAAYEQGMTSFRNGDLFSAMEPLRSAADAGYAPAQTTLAYILDLGEFNEDALHYYQMASDQDYPQGIHGLAGMVLIGDGTEKNDERAYKLFHRAAQLGYTDSWAALADGMLNNRLEPSSLGLDSETILSRSADAGYLRAIDALSLAYATGKYGIAVDTEKAHALAERAKTIRAERAGKKK